MEKSPIGERGAGAGFLPDFCRGPTLLAVLIITQLVAVVITLAAVDSGPLLWARFLLLSLYLHWIGLCCAAVLCFVRRHLIDRSEREVAGLCYLLLLAITAAISEAAWRMAALQDLFLLLETSHAEFLLRNLGVGAIVAALALRYFWVQHRWQQQMLAVGHARFAALQARIRPHFLFNTLNSIAELARSRPPEAETAVEDLSSLLHATLDQHDRPVTLREELEVARAYLRIEAQRLGERLQVRWQVADALAERPIPSLTLQPLLENAVRHGIEALPQGGVIHIEIAASANEGFEIRVRNPVADAAPRPGSGEALHNIRQRLSWLYGDGADLRTGIDGGHFHARLIFPATPPRALDTATP